MLYKEPPKPYIKGRFIILCLLFRRIPDTTYQIMVENSLLLKKKGLNKMS